VYIYIYTLPIDLFPLCANLCLPAESEREDDEEEEEEEEEAMYELVDRETPSGPLSDGGQETCKADPSDPGDVAEEEGDAADGDAETSQRALIEDIRWGLLASSYTVRR